MQLLLQQVGMPRPPHNRSHRCHSHTACTVALWHEVYLSSSHSTVTPGCRTANQNNCVCTTDPPGKARGQHMSSSMCIREHWAIPFLLGTAARARKQPLGLGSDGVGARRKLDLMGRRQHLRSRPPRHKAGAPWHVCARLHLPMETRCPIQRDLVQFV